MKNKHFKIKTATIALILMLAFSATILVLPIVSAHDPAWSISTWVYASVRNNPIGVGQDEFVIIWSNTVPPTATGVYGDRWTFYVDVTAPDGTKQTLGPITSDAVGSAYTMFTPTQVGEYTIVTKMVAHLITGEPVPPEGTPLDAPEWPRLAPGKSGQDYLGDTYEASESEPITLIVQEDPIEEWQETPLPTEYWTRPINNMNRDWYVLAGNWLAGAAQNVGSTTRFSYGLGPESAHVMWTTPMWDGGIMDERFGNIGYQTGHYEGLAFQPPIVLNGRIYYNVPSLPKEGWRVLDLYTGEEMWFQNTTGPITGIGGQFDYTGELGTGRLAFGQILNFNTGNQHGGLPYVWSTSGPGGTWMLFDAYTGNYICSIANVSATGTNVYGKEGSILYYNLDTTKNRLTVWNTTRAIWYEDEWQGTEYLMWRPTLNVTFDGNNGFSLNVSTADVTGSIYTIREGEFIIGGTPGKNNGTYIEDGQMWALSLKPGEEGTLLWTINYTPPEFMPDTAVNPMFGTRGYGGTMQGPYVDPEDGVFTFAYTLTQVRYGYSLETGELLWGPTEPEPPMNFYGQYTNYYEGKLLSFGYGGELIAYNVITGEILWRYEAKNVGYESPYGSNYPIYVTAIADGKLYTIAGEHSITQPMWRGQNLRCIDADTGEELWKVAFFGADGGQHLTGVTVVMADGYAVGLNYFDNQIYCFGKGPSATTVTVKDDSVPIGETIMISGTVTDQSTGAKGTPAIADEYMGEWMEYLYMQQKKPENAQGVTVKMSAYDPNGNYQNIGTTTVDTNGNFGKSWVPTIPGEYYVMAEFEGSKSYGSSSATTYFVVGPAPTPATPIAPEEPAASMISTELAIILAIVVFVVLGIVAFWALRKRK